MDLDLLTCLDLVRYYVTEIIVTKSHEIFRNSCYLLYRDLFIRQVVDMRWGISDPTTAIDVCLEEIKRCHESSYGPAFVSCLSHRYGTKCLQTKIPLEEFNQIHSSLSSEGKNLINEFYENDKNFKLTPMYVLKSESEAILKNVNILQCTITINLS